jgi:toxin ParE1/3/4
VARKVVFLRSAQKDLLGILDYISDQAGFVIAHNYVDRIEEACLSLATFPERGTRYGGNRPSLRKIGFERRATIVHEARPAVAACCVARRNQSRGVLRD